jgi:hypothetical protein
MDTYTDVPSMDDDMYRRWYWVDGVLYCEDLTEVTLPCPKSSDMADVLIKAGYIFCI